MKRVINLALGLSLIAAMGSSSWAAGKPENPCGDKSMKSAMHSQGQTLTFSVDDPMGRNAVTFKSSAPLEDIVGTSNKITGELVFDPSNPQNGGHGDLTVSVKSINTGIPLRDDHLASADWLNAAQYPDITFKITELRDVKKTTGTADAQSYDVKVVGDFSLHGVTKQLTIPGRITYLKENDMTRQKLPGNLLAARAEFVVALADYGITGPKGMPIVGSKVGNTIDVELSVIGNSGEGANASMASSNKPMNPCGDKAAGATMKAGNPCGDKAAAMNKPQNPCGDKKTPNPENPCGGKSPHNL